MKSIHYSRRKLLFLLSDIKPNNNILVSSSSNRINHQTTTFRFFFDQMKIFYFSVLPVELLKRPALRK